MVHNSIMVLCGGIAVFMFGMSLVSENLQKLAANRLRDLLCTLSDNRLLSIGLGVVLTVLLQSSGAVTSMLVGLGSAGVVSLSQVMGVIIGSAIGSTFTVLIISFKIAEFGLPIFTLCFAVYFISQRRILKLLMGTGMGFGLIFWGLELISLGSDVFNQSQMLKEFLTYASRNPALTLTVAAIATGLAHSSSVVIGFAMGLASQGVISLYDAAFWIYGANIGTTSTALFAAAGGNYVGRQVAWAHVFYKVATVAMMIFFTQSLVGVVETFQLSSSQGIAVIHVLYNFVAALIFFPFIKLGAELIQKMFPPLPHEKEFGVKYIGRSTYESSALALSYSSQEIYRMGDIVLGMIKDSVLLFRGSNLDLEDSVTIRAQRAEMLFNEIKMFMLRFANETKEGISQKVFDMISFASDLEKTSDVINSTIKELARKKQDLKIDFSPAGWNEIQEMHAMVVKISSLSLSCFQLQSSEVATHVIELKREIRKLEKKLREHHLERLHRGLKESINTSSIHLDLLNEFRRVVGLMANFSYTFFRDNDPRSILGKGN